MYLGRTKNYQFYSLEVDHCPPTKLQRIAEACQAVEAAVWNPASDFIGYMQNQSAVLYAKKGEQIVGFALFELHVENNSLVVAANECMVLPEHHGAGLANLFLAILVRHIRKDKRRRRIERNYKSITFISLTVNFKMMEAFRRYSGLLTDRCTFHPDQEILKVAENYMIKESLEPLNPPQLFFVKGAFPRAIKIKPNMQVPSYVPDNFDLERGDAFLYCGRVTKFLWLGLVSFFFLWKARFRLSQRLIPIGRFSKSGIKYVRHK